MIKRTPIIDKDDKQLYLDDGMRKYAYWIVVTNSTRSNTAVLRIAQGRGNQENLMSRLPKSQERLRHHQTPKNIIDSSLARSPVK